MLTLRLKDSSIGDKFCPDTVLHPPRKESLLRRIRTENGVRSVAGVGRWTDWVTSIEMRKCLELGYTFKIKKGVIPLIWYNFR